MSDQILNYIDNYLQNPENWINTSKGIKNILLLSKRCIIPYEGTEMESHFDYSLESLKHLEYAGLNQYEFDNFIQNSPLLNLNKLEIEEALLAITSYLFSTLIQNLEYESYEWNYPNMDNSLIRINQLEVIYPWKMIKERMTFNSDYNIYDQVISKIPNKYFTSNKSIENNIIKNDSESLSVKYYKLIEKINSKKINHLQTIEEIEKALFLCNQNEFEEVAEIMFLGVYIQHLDTKNNLGLKIEKSERLFHLSLNECVICSPYIVHIVNHFKNEIKRFEQSNPKISFQLINHCIFLAENFKFYKFMNEEDEKRMKGFYDFFSNKNRKLISFLDILKSRF